MVLLVYPENTEHANSEPWIYKNCSSFFHVHLPFCWTEGLISCFYIQIFILLPTDSIIFEQMQIFFSVQACFSSFTKCISLDVAFLRYGTVQELILWLIIDLCTKKILTYAWTFYLHIFFLMYPGGSRVEIHQTRDTWAIAKAYWMAIHNDPNHESMRCATNIGT